MTSRALKMEQVVVLVAIAIGMAIGGSQIGDNSTLVHLTTGRLIIDSSHIPTADPYSFSAAGHHWTVQSWLPETLYGFLYELGGSHWLQVLNMGLYGATGGVLALLARTGHWVRTGVVLAVAFGLSAAQWSPRPPAFGFFFLALTVLIVERKRSVWWLAPIGALWINSHGTWPLGLAYIFALVFGAKADEIPTYLKYFGILFLGVLVGGLVSPAGWDVFTFPLIPFGDRAPVFAAIAEWMSPNFRTTDFWNGPAVLVSFMTVLLIVSRSQPLRREVAVLVVFVAAALLGLRNLPALAIVAAPILARSLSVSSSPTVKIGSPLHLIATSVKFRHFLTAASVVCMLGVIAIAFSRPGFDLHRYPQAGVKYLEASNEIGPDKRVLAPDWIGCYIIFEKSREANVFIDDRYDMYPASVAEAARHLSHVDQDPQLLLQQYKFDAVLLPRGAQLAVYLGHSPAWDSPWSDANFQIFTPRIGTNS